MSRWKDLNNDLDFLSIDNKLYESESEHYKILIADDDKEIHDVTKLVLKDFEFDGSHIEFVDAYNGEEVIRELKANEDIAVIFLDVVMENRDTGLTLIKRIRNDLNNQQVRIILRTGQPGDAPEQEVIRSYDINDYRLKTELTARKLETVTYGALRNFRDLMMVERNRKMNEKLLVISSNLLAHRSIGEFFENVLIELSKMKKVPSSKIVTNQNLSKSGFVAIKEDYYKVIAAYGKYEKYEGQMIDVGIAPFIADESNLRSKIKEHIYLVEKGFLIEFKGNSEISTMIYVEGNSALYDFELISLFLTNFSIALDNYLLNNLLQKSQRDIIFALGETVENHFEDTGEHVKRTSEMMFRFASCLSLSYQEAELLSLACTLHDLGKIVIPDNILKKPGRLTDDEFLIMKTHAMQGYNILCNSELPMIKSASIIAKYHHERYDGTGYPEGLEKDQIPFSARIMSIIDSFDAMTNERVYKKAISIEDAKKEVIRCKGKHFDPELTEVFLNNVNYIIGNE